MVLKTLRQKIDVLVGEDRGVSPVIGVILMVAITVILAAVIGAFVLGLGEDMSTGVQAGATITNNGADATVTWNSEGNADKLTINVESGSASPTELSEPGATSTVSPAAAGDEVTITVVAQNGDESAVVAQESMTLG